MTRNPIRLGGLSLTVRARKRPGPRPEDFPQPLPPRSPERSSVQMPFGGYPTASRDYTYYGAPVKRQRTSMDFGNRGIYDADGRIRQMDTYPPAATMLSNPPGPYQTPMMPGYTGPTGVPDYTVRQPAPIVPSTYGSSEDPMLAVRSSPGSGYMAHYPTYTDGQLSYGMPPSSRSVPFRQGGLPFGDGRAPGGGQ